MSFLSAIIINIYSYYRSNTRPETLKHETYRFPPFTIFSLLSSVFSFLSVKQITSLAWQHFPSLKPVSLIPRFFAHCALFALALLFAIPASARDGQDSASIVRKTIGATRVTTAPRIDGQLDEDVWKDAQVAAQFIQNNPKEGADVSFQTEVRIMYDNTALYIGAMMYDNSPDSIMKQLGLRDDYLTADNFRMVFDTYNTEQDAFDFAVTASGVQSDSRWSDANYNAVWQSNVSIMQNGWCAEIAIPWSALRFPTAPDQTWGLQMTRTIQRKYEFDQWALTPKDKPNPIKYWGLLTGLKNINVPVRLSLTPYLTTIWQNDDRFGQTKPSTSLSGGMDLKYGINESFTLDMTLLPDFSQVKSDDVVKNLGPFEVQFTEQRPFFTEGVDLFGDGDIFYSRRIGRTPHGFYDAPDETDSNEVIIKNPSQSKLLNATKISGRTNGGLGIGVLNAFVDNTYAIARDTLTGETRKILTEARSNYNIFVFEKQLAHSSKVYVTNTNVIRSHGYRSANVTATGFSLNNKRNTWHFFGNGGVSDIMNPVDTAKGLFTSSIGYYYFNGIEKNSGKLQYGLSQLVVSRNWDCNDMGINLETNYANNNAWIAYNIFNPWKIFNYGTFSLNFTYNYNLTTGRMNSVSINPYAYMQFRNFWSAYIGSEVTPVDSRDYYEPRVEGRYYMRTRYQAYFGGINSNQNKKIYGGIDFHGGITGKIGPTVPRNPWGGGSIYLNWRAGNRFTVGASSGFHGDFGDRGWVDEEDDGTIVFGRRILRTIENTASASFVFTRDMSVAVTARHYWSTGHYLNYFVLNEDGTLTDYVNYSGSHDFSFNSFNVDLVYNWIFAPGSVLSIAWKQNILAEDETIDYSYNNNLSHTLHAPQLNQVSVRVLYYLDYNSVKNSISRH